jgi:hypothetical protein
MAKTLKKLSRMEASQASPICEPEGPTEALPPSNRDVDALAYRLWQKRGCPQGSPEDDWFAAEQMLKSEQIPPRRMAAGQSGEDS